MQLPLTCHISAQRHICDLVGRAKIGGAFKGVLTRGNRVAVDNFFGHVAVATDSGFALFDLEDVAEKARLVRYLLFRSHTEHYLRHYVGSRYRQE